PPATVSFLNGQLGLFLFQIPMSFVSPAASPPPVHQEKTWSSHAALLDACRLCPAAGTTSATTTSPRSAALRASPRLRHRGRPESTLLDIYTSLEFATKRVEYSQSTGPCQAKGPAPATARQRKAVGTRPVRSR